MAIEDRPIPKIKEPTDIIVKVIYTALCGSELHVFRGHQPSPTGFIMGHEFTGTVEEMGSDVKNFKKGDQIVSPFTISWYSPECLIVDLLRLISPVENASIASTASRQDARKELYSAPPLLMELKLNTSDVTPFWKLL